MRMMYAPLGLLHCNMSIKEWDMNFGVSAIAPREMRSVGNLMINHAIRRAGRVGGDCHSPEGTLDFDRPGDPPDRAAELGTS